MQGIIKRISPGKGFCFITGNDNVDYFLHRSDFNGHWNDLIQDFHTKPEIKVIFDISEQNQKGPRASNCRRRDYPND